MSFDDPQFGEVWVHRVRGTEVLILMTDKGEVEFASHEYENSPHTFRPLEFLQAYYEPKAPDTP